MKNLFGLFRSLFFRKKKQQNTRSEQQLKDQQAFAEEYSARIFEKILCKKELSYMESFTLDLAADHNGLPISRMYETSKLQLREYMESDEFWECLSTSQYMGNILALEQAGEKKPDECWNDQLMSEYCKEQLLGAREYYGNIPDRELSLVDLTIYHFEVNRWIFTPSAKQVKSAKQKGISLMEIGVEANWMRWKKYREEMEQEQKNVE